jgi:hypothetical protein
MRNQPAPTMTLYRVYNGGEIPHLAHGWRSVIALPPGRKWITVIDWTTLETSRLAIAEWDRLEPMPDRRINRRKVRAAMRRRLKYVTPTQAVRDALATLAHQAR